MGGTGNGGKVMRIVLRTYSTPRYPQASTWKVERSEWPPASVLWPVRDFLNCVP